MEQDLNSLNCYIICRPNGLFVVTLLKPIITPIRFTQKLDVYIPYGDPVGCLNIDPYFIYSLFENNENTQEWKDILNRPLEINRIKLYGKYCTEKYTHLVTRQHNNLFKIKVRDFEKEYIANICQWFVETLFKDEEGNLQRALDASLPVIPVHFSGIVR